MTGLYSNEHFCDFWCRAGKVKNISMKKITFVSTLASILIAGSVQAQVCDSVTVTGPPSGAPSSWAYNGTLVGASVELAQMTLRAAGVKNVTIKTFPSWTEALESTRRGDVDMIFSAGWSSERARYLTYVYPAYAYQFLQVIVRKGTGFPLNSYADLKGRVGIAGRGETFGDSTFGLFVEKELQLQRSPNISASIDKLLAGDVDYVLAYENAAYSEIYTKDLGDKVSILPTYPFRVDTFFAFSKRSKCASALIPKVEAEILKAAKRNEFYLLTKKYRMLFNESQEAPVSVPSRSSR